MLQSCHGLESTVERIPTIPTISNLHPIITNLQEAEFVWCRFQADVFRDFSLNRLPAPYHVQLFSGVFRIGIFIEINFFLFDCPNDSLMKATSKVHFIEPEDLKTSAVIHE